MSTSNSNSSTTNSTTRGPGGYYDSNRSNSIDSHDWGNIAVVNSGTNPVINFSFMIRVEGAFDLPCRSVKGFTKENEFDYIQEGGVNDYVHMRRKPISKPFTLQVERYVGVDYVDPLPLGAELVLPVILFVNKYCFPTFKPVATYTFTGCTVISKTTGDLNAEASGLFVETTTIAYREMAVIKIPSQAYDLDEDTWSFLDGGTYKGKKGNGKFHRLQASSNKEYSSSNVVGEKSKSEMNTLAEANVYEINSDTNGKRRHENSKENHKVYTPTALSARTQKQMEANNALWNPSKAITTGVISKEDRAVHGKVNGSANHTREKWDKETQIREANKKKFDINKKVSAENGSAKRLGPSEKEPSAETMEKSAEKNKYSIKKKASSENGSAKRLGPNSKEPSADSMVRRARKKKYSIKDDTNKAAKANKQKSSKREKLKSEMVSKADENKFPANNSAKTNPMTTPEARLWPNEPSVKQKPGVKPPAREWPKEESAKKKPMKKGETRSWPSQNSANTKAMKPSGNRSWPNESSAITKPMKKSEARLWPKVKSAQNITDFLNKQ